MLATVGIGYLFGVAIHTEGGSRVIVSENVSQLRSAVLGDELFRLLGIGLMGIIADGVVRE